MKIRAEKTLIMMALLLVNVSSMVGTSNSQTREGAHMFNSYSTSSAGSATEWNETYGGHYDDEAYSLINTGDGGYALAGSFSTGAFNSYFWLVKTDLTGTELWNKTYGYGGTNYDKAYSVIQTSDGGYALAGSVTNSYGNGGSDAWLVKTDQNGNELWNQTYGGTGDNEAYSVIQTSNNGYALAGYTNSSGNGGYDAWLVKTDSGGNIVWDQTYGGTGDDRAYSVIQTSNNGYALAGYTNSSGHGTYDFWLVKTDANGTMQWSQTYGGTGNDRAYSVIQTSNNGYALAGYTNSSGHGTYDSWLVKTDANGTMQWSQPYGGTGDDYARALVQTTDGGYALAGYTDSFGAGGYDFWLVKTDANGTMQWDKTYGGTFTDEAYALVQANGGGYALAGYTYSPGMNNDAWLVKTAPEYYTLNITVSATAGGTTDPAPGTYTYANGTVVAITASPISGYFFDHWELDGKNITRAFNPTGVSMDRDHQLEAVFEPLQCTLNITATAGGTTDPAPGTYTYPYDQYEAVEAIPDPGNYLDHWVLDGIDQNIPSSTISLYMFANYTLNAVFSCPHDIAVINVAASKTSVGQNQSTGINCIVSNVGKFTEDFNVTFSANFTVNSKATVLYSTQVELASGHNYTVLWIWNTSGYSMGNYTLIGSVPPVENETITADNTFVRASIAVTIPGDINGDFNVTLQDLVFLAKAYNPHSVPGMANWNPNADINGNGIVDLSDLVLLTQHYLQHYP